MWIAKIIIAELVFYDEIFISKPHPCVVKYNKKKNEKRQRGERIFGLIIILCTGLYFKIW